jgi:hypothetical protein
MTGNDLIKKSKERNKIHVTRDHILTELTQFQIMEYYTGQPVMINFPFKSPFREDTKAGCKFIIQAGKLYFRDYSQEIMWDCFSVVMNKFNISFPEALERIHSDMGVGKFKPNTYKPIEEYPEEKLKYQIKAEGWDEESLEYWKQFGITEPTLKRFKVFNTKRVYKNGKFSSRSTRANPIYTYVLKSGNCKNYRPLAKAGNKWWGNTSKSDIFGYDLLPDEGEELIITSSLKDAMTAYELGHHNVIAPQSEISNFDIDLIDDLENRFKRITVIYDNDATGIAKMEECCMKYGWRYKIPPLKDISDTYKSLGKKATQNFLGEDTYQIEWELSNIPF